MKQDQRKVENILESNQQSEVENDFREFFDSDREDARDIIQSIYGSEEEIDVHVYYPRIACTIFEVRFILFNNLAIVVFKRHRCLLGNFVIRDKHDHVKSLSSSKEFAPRALAEKQQQVIKRTIITLAKMNCVFI